MYARKTRTACSDSAPPVHPAMGYVLDNSAKTCDQTDNIESPVTVQCSEIQQWPTYGVVAANEQATEKQREMRK